MSATLTWASSGNCTKTGTANANFLDDLDTLITAQAGNAAFFWQKAGKQSVTTPLYLLLSRKDGSVGRIAIIIWSSSPAANNAAILDTTPGTSLPYIAWFPAGNANTLSNLASASGTICGDDTNAVKVCPFQSIGTSYGASFVTFYMDSAEGMVFGAANPGAVATYIMGAGKLAIDSSDVVYDCTFGSGGQSAATWGSNSTGTFPWSVTAILAGTSNTAQIRVNYGTNNKLYFNAWLPSGVWASQAVGSSDILTDTSVTKVWFVPTQLLGQTKGEGFALKFRQFGYGPGTTGPLTVYNTTGPVVAARQFCNSTTGNNGSPWFTQFKL